MADTAIGSMMRATAVLLIHMESRADARRKAPKIDDWRVPASPRRKNANLVWRWQLCIPCAMSIPPKNKKITGLANGAAAPAIPQMPSMGKNTSGNMAVTAKGITSETHSEAMRTATPKVCQPAGCSPEGAGTSRT